MQTLNFVRSSVILKIWFDYYDATSTFLKTFGIISLIQIFYLDILAIFEVIWRYSIGVNANIGGQVILDGLRKDLERTTKFTFLT